MQKLPPCLQFCLKLLNIYCLESYDTTDGKTEEVCNFLPLYTEKFWFYVEMFETFFIFFGHLESSGTISKWSYCVGQVIVVIYTA